MNVARGTENVQVQVWIDGIFFLGWGMRGRVFYMGVEGHFESCL